MKNNKGRVRAAAASMPSLAINWADISVSWEGSSSGNPGQFSRKLKQTSCRITLRHRPTAITVQGEVAPGNYSKRHMQSLRAALEEKLMVELERRVLQRLKRSKNKDADACR